MNIKLPVRCVVMSVLLYTTPLHAFNLPSIWTTTRIADIKQQARLLNEDTLMIQGLVSQASQLPGLKMYRLQDDSDSIWIITEDRLPKLNTRLKVMIRVEHLMIFGNNSLGLHLSEMQRF